MKSSSDYDNLICAFTFYCVFSFRPREFIDCVSHIRLLSWLLLGSLSHTAITKASGPIMCQPLPLEASSYIADHIMVILSGFAEQSKVCMSSPCDPRVTPFYHKGVLIKRVPNNFFFKRFHWSLTYLSFLNAALIAYLCGWRYPFMYVCDNVIIYVSHVQGMCNRSEDRWVLNMWRPTLVLFTCSLLPPVKIIVYSFF